MIELNIGLDLGSDTLKIAYAFQKEGRLRYGKLMRGSTVMQAALPAVAYYDEAEARWLFGEDVEQKEERSFINVVKIKSLLSLLLRGTNAKAAAANAEYYFRRDVFPKFYFPERVRAERDFRKAEQAERTFRAPGHTPQQVCGAFFTYAMRVAIGRIAALARTEQAEFSPQVRIAAVYPSKAGKAYVTEFTRLVRVAFGNEPVKVISSTKALSMYAYHRGVLQAGESVLVFDLGEEDISVAKATLLGGGHLSVDGADGHSAPKEIGGDDIDDAVARYIEDAIAARETVGSPSYGQEGHIFERGLHSKQYLFMKDIKKAKVILSMPFGGSGAFAQGVPVGVSRDLYIQRKLTREEFAACVGTANNTGVARRIAAYILEELGRPVNDDVKKVFLSGGPVETYGLLPFLKEQTAKRFPGVRFYTFDDDRTQNDGFSILSYEDSVYAPAVGGAIVACMDFDVKTVISLSYATWGSAALREPGGLFRPKEKVLSIFADRGTFITDGRATGDGRYRFSTGMYVTARPNGEAECVSNEQIYSTIVTNEDIRNKKYGEKLGRQYAELSDGTTGLVLGDDDSEMRRRAQAYVDLKVVAGGGGARILFYYSGRRVRLTAPRTRCAGAEKDGSVRIYFEEGMTVTEEGRAAPYIGNAVARNKDRSVDVLPAAGADGWNGGRRTVSAADIEFRFEGLDADLVVANED